jgi:uncharacterized protein YbcC (UPF0753/DUF2309 family)
MSITKGDLKVLIDEEAKILPDQAPLEYFVHHNNLHHFENNKFEEVVEDMFYNYGKTAYMHLSYYRKKLADNEIRKDIFIKYLNENGFEINDPFLIGFIRDRLHSYNDPKHLEFLKSENKMYSKDASKLIPMQEDDIKLWNTISDIKPIDTFETFPDYHVNRSLSRINKILIPLVSALLDQGQAGIVIGDMGRSHPLKAFKLYTKSLLSKEALKLWDELCLKPDLDEVIIDEFFKGKTFSQVRKIIKEHLHSLPGWAGMIYKVERNKEVIPRKDVYLGINEYLLMRLFLSRFLVKKSQTEVYTLASDTQIKENIFNFVKYYSSEYNYDYLYDLFCRLNQIKLRRIFQQSYEFSFYATILSGLQSRKKSPSKNIKYQMFFCIDDREESLRRYLEEESNQVATFGVAGFFGLDMMFQGVGEQYPRRFCPPAAKPAYFLQEEGESVKFNMATIFHDTHNGFFKSLLYNFLIAPLKSIESNWHLYFPREKRVLSKLIRRNKKSKINFERIDSNEGSSFFKGYSLEESAFRVNNILKGAGLYKDFAAYILMIGHGHDSYNNPHIAAYRCGACSGANAAPNAKIFAQMANDPRIRKILKEKYNLDIPNSTYFIGGYHDTCNDNIELYNIDFNKIDSQDYRELCNIIDKARAKNAKERCLRFFQVDNNITPERALKSVEKRSWHVSEPRPELNHATNSLCIVGKRNLTQNVFLDRKSFLVSYDSSIDSDGSILQGLLSAVIPVCAGINLEYYFSKVDTENYGSGSKTSHNVTGFMGVMNGVRGDLRTGLVWQMVEYHDPLRILFIIESTPKIIHKIMEKNQEVKNLIENKWISLALINPQDFKEILFYEQGDFIPFNQEVSFEINTYLNSNEVPTGLESPIHVAYIEDKP